MSEYSIEKLHEKLRYEPRTFAENKHKFYAQGTFDSRCRVGKIKNKSHIYLYYSKHHGKFKIFKPGQNDDKYLIADIDKKDIKKSIDYNYDRRTDGCIINYTDINTKKKCKVVLTPCDETKRKTKYDKCPIPDRHFDTPVPFLTNWKYLLNLWILESPSRGDDKSKSKSKSKPTRKLSPPRRKLSLSTRNTQSTRKKPSISTRKTKSRTQSTRKPSPSTRKSQSRRGGAKKYHKATKKHRRKNIKKTRKNK